jgi:hypothetical protein
MATLRSGRVRLAADCGAINGLRALLPPAPDAMMDVSRIQAGHAGPALAAAAKLALIGAMAAAAERFHWQDVLGCAAFCQEAFAPSDLTKAL